MKQLALVSYYGQLDNFDEVWANNRVWIQKPFTSKALDEAVDEIKKSVKETRGVTLSVVVIMSVIWLDETMEENGDAETV